MARYDTTGRPPAPVLNCCCPAVNARSRTLTGDHEETATTMI
jgi:hypothetical protein